MTTTFHYLLLWQHVIYLIQLTCWKENGSTKQARRWWMGSKDFVGCGSSIMSPRKWDPGEQKWMRRHSMWPLGRRRSPRRQLQTCSAGCRITRLLPFLVSTSLPWTSFLWGSPPSHQEAPKKIKLSCYISQFLLVHFEKRKEGQCLLTAGYEPANVIHVFSLNSLQPLYKVSVIVLFYRVVIFLDWEHTNTRWECWEIIPGWCGLKVWWLLTFLLSKSLFCSLRTCVYREAPRTF